MKYKTCWISDLHLGSKGCQVQAIYDFLKHNQFDKLYLVGDIIDIWRIQRKGFLPGPLAQLHLNVLQIILKKAKKGTTVIYIPGNHDEFISHFLDDFKHMLIIGNIVIVDQDIHVTADGRRLIVMHGHEFDVITKYHRWVAILGDVGYNSLLWINRHFNIIRSLLGMRYWSLSKFIKLKVKDAVNFISKFEESVAKYAEKHNAQGIVCGHLHVPQMRFINSCLYLNDGDWVESCTALVEHYDGSLEILELRKGVMSQFAVLNAYTKEVNKINTTGD